ncbi:MAG: hypothetical protein AAF267_00500 [Deinococcota bacterium]
MERDAVVPQSYIIVTEADHETQAELAALLEAYRSSLKAHGLIIHYEFTLPEGHDSQANHMSDPAAIGRFVVLVEPSADLSSSLRAAVDAEVRALSDALSVIASYEVNTFFKT